MGRPLPGIDLRIDDGELVADPATVPTFFRGYLGAEPHDAGDRWRTGDRVRADDDGYLYFEGRTDDVIISAGLSHRPVRGRVRARRPPGCRPRRRSSRRPTTSAARSSARSSCCVTRRPHRRRSPSELQEHVKHETAPYKYPRRIEFAAELPKTPSGKIRRALLREQG